MPANRFPTAVALAGGTLFALSLVLPRLVARLDHPAPRPQVTELPADASLDVIIPSYLEAGIIGAKITRLRADLATWPGNARIVVVASDDETAEAARGADSVLRVPRDGKASACNRGVAASTADVVVLTDANCAIGPDSWPDRLRASLADWSLVSANKTESGGSEQAFWALERATKASMNAGTLSVAGEFLAFRRKDYRPVPRSTVLDDLSIALSFTDRGLAVTVAPDIETIEDAVVGREQWERRVRIAGGLFVEALPRLPALLRNAPGRLFMAHKLYRMTLGCAGFWAFIAGAALIFPPLTLAIPLIVAYLAVSYHVPRIALGSLAPATTVVGLQTVPPAAAFRSLLTRRHGERAGLWKKIPR